MNKKSLIKESVLLDRYHTYGINACSRFLIEIESAEEVKEAFSFIQKKELSFIVIGRGSNVLFKDDYFNGVVLINKMTEFEVDGNKVKAAAGVNLPLLSRKVSKMNLSGFEKLVGVPGTVGGAICMNAGVQGCEISDHLVCVEVMTKDGKKKMYKKDQCGFRYRSSKFLADDEFILSAEFELKQENNVFKRVQENLKKRLISQPIEEKNSGCIFKNPDGYSAGNLIDQCGLKGFSVGGAQVSKKHANFINNIDNASYKDVMELIKEVQEVVRVKKGVELKYEVRII
ncbi:MAG: UDP-N-acetylenolpyruvoylglucosamine reductase [Chlamydiia bacterium]|nr:UDP-N-acetylenolpyruvoylglucosamine reductase [Chlamydiia bacterium]